MNVYEGKNIRNVGIVGHGGSGKTSLISAILFDTGATTRLGRVDDGNAPTDYDEDEIERKITISAKLAFCEWNKNKINMLDTPGFGNFIQEARGALRVADAAVVRRGCRVRRDGPDRKGVGLCRGVWTAPDDRRQPNGPRYGKLRTIAGLDPATARPNVRSDPDSYRRGKGLQGRRRSGLDEGVSLCGRRYAQSSPKAQYPRMSKRARRSIATSSSNPSPRATKT